MHTRITFMTPTAALAAFALIFCTLIDPLRAEDWPQFLGPTRDGVYRGKDIAPAWPKDGPKLLWNVDTRHKFAVAKKWHGMVCSPLVEGNAVLLNIGSTNNAGIVAFDKNSGDVLWQSTKHGFSCSSPVAATIDGKRYAFFFTRRTLCAVDPANGKVYFNYAVSTPNKDLVLCANPVIIDDLVFFSAPC